MPCMAWKSSVPSPSSGWTAKEDSKSLHKLFRKALRTRTPNPSTQWLTSLGRPGPGYDPRVLPQLIDRIAERRPGVIWASIPLTDDPAGGFRDVSYREFADGINRATDRLERAIGVGTTDERIAYLAGSEISSIFITIAAAKLGCQVLFLSPRNSLEGQLSLIDKVECRFLMTPEMSLPQASEILQERPSVKHLRCRDLNSFLTGPLSPPRPFKGTFEQLRNVPFWYVHSSGTTSLPKPVGWSYGANAAWMHEMAHSYPDGQHVLQDLMARSSKLFNAFPLFHAAGMVFPLIHAPASGMELVFPPNGTPMTAAVADRMHASSKAPFAILEPPMITEELVKDETYFKNLLHQQLILTGAAALPKQIGDKIIECGVPLRNMVAASETGIPPLMVPNPPEKWNAFHFARDQGLELEHINDGRYELVHRKLKDGRRIQAVFENFPELDVYRTNDMFMRHPDLNLPHLWVIAGRADDVIVLLNGEKFTPTTLEEDVVSQVGVKSALVFGMQRENAALLLEPVDPIVSRSASESREFLDRLWPAIEKANLRVAAHGRIMRSHVLVTRPDKPFLRTPKGSVPRSKMYDLYAPEMDALYSVSDVTSDRTAVSEHGTADTGTPADLKQRISQLIKIDATRLGDDDNIFSMGFDSLHAIQMTRSLQKELGKDNFRQVMIYDNPTIRQLSAVILKKSTSRQHEDVDGAAHNTRTVITLFDSFAKALPRVALPQARVCILTGSSGGLGQHLLAQLQDSSFSHIYCFTRIPPPPSPWRKVTYIQADLSAPNFGLAAAQYATLLRTVTHIIHNAWLVDFNRPLSFFTRNIESVQSFIDFAATSRCDPQIIFISSVSAVLGAPVHPTTNAVEETMHPLNRPFDSAEDDASLIGYAQSKRVAELLLARAGEVSGVRSIICRLGQIAGSSIPGSQTQDGKPLPSWQARDWLPRLLASSKHLGCVPSDLGCADYLNWTPIDHVASAVLDLANSDSVAAWRPSKSSSVQVFHLLNPAPAPQFGDLLPTIRRILGNGTTESIRVVPPRQWIDELEESVKMGTPEKSLDMDGNAGASLTQFYRRTLLGEAYMPKLDTTLACQISKTLKGEVPMNDKWMAQWMEEWFGPVGAQKSL